VTRRARLLAEWLIVAALVTWRTTGGAAHSPERLLRWLFGDLPALRFSELHPWLSLQLGIDNLFLLAGLLLVLAKAAWAERARWAVVLWFLFTLVVLPVLRDVEIRLHVDDAPGNTRPYVSQTHDGGVVQTELAGAALRRGENPYRMSFAGTSMARTADSDAEGWRLTGYDHNPAFDHVPYLPAVLGLAALWRHGDIRILYLALALAYAWLLARRFPPGPERRLALLLAVCNPLLLPYLVAGRNEVLLLLPLVLFGSFASDGRWRAAAWALGAALCFKQFAVAAVPFFVLWRRREWKQLWPVVALPLATCLPFLVWDARAFLEDAVLWSLGGAPDAYPVKWTGWGMSALAYGLNLVEEPRAANPFGWLALPAQLLALLLLGRRVWREPTAQEMLLASGVFLYVMLFTSRAFAFNYLIVPSLLLVLAWRKETHEPLS
jgi:hypothetical protein